MALRPLSDMNGLRFAFRQLLYPQSSSRIEGTRLKARCSDDYQVQACHAAGLRSRRSYRPGMTFLKSNAWFYGIPVVLLLRT
jgi:hypothetical protein